MILFDDSGWKYSFIILMTVIFIACGIYTYLKAYRSQKQEEKFNAQPKEENKNVQNNIPFNEESVILKKAENDIPTVEPLILDEDTIIKKRINR